MIIILLVQGIVFSARIVKFVVESVVTGSAIGQSLLGSGKGVGQSGPFTVGNRPCDGCSGDYKMLCEFGGVSDGEVGSAVTNYRRKYASETLVCVDAWWMSSMMSWSSVIQRRLNCGRAVWCWR